MIALILLRRILIVASRHIPTNCRESMAVLAAIALCVVALTLLEPAAPLPSPQCVDTFANLLESGDDLNAARAAQCLSSPVYPATPAGVAQ